jgi:hypothetical protein
MNIVSFWNEQVNLWNEQHKCGFCWEFSAPLVSSQINIFQNENCCVKIFLTDVKFREERKTNFLTGLTEYKKCIWSFSLYAVLKENLGVNNYNEIKGHSIEESKWETIFYPLINCLGCDNILDTCVILGKEIQIAQNGDAQLIHNYLDENYNGWKINYIFSEIT